MTLPRNAFIADSVTRVAAPISPSQALNQGDMVKISGGLVVPVTTPGTDALFGVADTTNPVTSLLDQLSTISVIRRGIVRMILTNGDAVVYDTPLYIGADAQTVTVVQPGSAAPIGRCRELVGFTGDGVALVKVDLMVAESEEA